VLAGRYLIDPDMVRVLGRPAFHDTTLTAHRAFLGGTFPFDVDIRVRDILARHTDVDPARQARLVQILDVDLEWRMHRVSDGQRRRVQILLGLLKPSELLLLDEVTTDLDVIARADLLAFLREESESRGLTILYATHIFDGLESWASHLAHVAHGRLRHMAPLGGIPELVALQTAHAPAPLLCLVEGWLREKP
jgi:CCR4-NOT complex subunit CAF16